MNKIIRYAKIAIAALVTVAMGACTSDYEYDTPEALKGAQVYFSNTLPSKIEVNKEAGNFDVTLSRQNTEGELTVPLMFTADEGNIYTVPSTVTFADGEATANIHITFNPDELVYGNYVGGTISFDADNFSTPYGATSYKFTAGASAYVDVAGGKGNFRDGIISSLYGIEMLDWDVQIQQDAHNPGIYRVVAPYGQKGWSGANPWYTAFDENESNTDMIIDATDPDFVYIKGTFNTGVTLNSSDGVISYLSFIQSNLDNGVSLDVIKAKKPEWFGTFKDGVFTFPAGKTAYACLNGEPVAYANADGMLRVAMPGVVLKDYSVGVEYLGRMTDTNDNDNAIFNLTFGADVTTVKYALVKEGEDLNKTESGIIDGSVEATEISEAGRVEVPFEESGNYYLVTVSYENGEAKGADATPVTLKSSKDAEEQFEEVAYGVFTMGVKDVSAPFFESGAIGCFVDKIGGQSPYAGEATLLQSKSDPSHFRITPWLNKGYDFDFTWNQETGAISVTNLDCGIEGNNNGDHIMVDDVLTIAGEQNTNALGLGNSYSNNVLTFNLAYHLGTSFLAIEQEQFEITATAESAAKKNTNKVAASHFRNNKHVVGKSYQMNKKFVNCKTIRLK